MLGFEDYNCFLQCSHFSYPVAIKRLSDSLSVVKCVAAPALRAAKAIGRTVRNFDEKEWKANARRFVTEGNIEKFKQNPELLEFLLGTGDAILVEAAPLDVIWGQDNSNALTHQLGAVKTFLALRSLMQDGPEEFLDGPELLFDYGP